MLVKQLKSALLLSILFLLMACKPVYSVTDFSTEQQPLIRAIQKGNVEQVKNLAVTTDLKTLSKRGLPILTVAMYEARGDRNSDKSTPRLDIITELMKAGVPFDQRGEFSDSPLSIALAQEHPAFLQAMLEGGLEPNYIQGFSAIIFQLLSDDKLDIVKILIDFGADIEMKNSGGETPAFSAMKGIGQEISSYLVSIGAETDVINDLNTRTFAMATFKAEKFSTEAIARIKSGLHKGNLAMFERRLKAIKQVKAIMIERGQQWPPEK
ncbi:ankyrin repeat domain-containing protein [Pasteurella testudinis]|uniref:ankyrin repeat domain-containing protein n=1 Tax=Pasteurella testudinis TaxID=761 RepID=UPI000DFDF1EA|nr:ankyrin repeat domain-containing protein [Pasteurella testudinis]SUB52155.1 Ankyrin repeats (3 copies) [Pasteurella testudinis]